MQRENLLQLQSSTEHTSIHQQRNHLHRLSYNSLYSTLLRQRQPKSQRNKQKVQDRKGHVMKMKKRMMCQWMKMTRMTRWTYLTKIKKWTTFNQSPYLVSEIWGSIILITWLPRLPKKVEQIIEQIRQPDLTKGSNILLAWYHFYQEIAMPLPYYRDEQSMQERLVRDGPVK